jgi:hypothetical protein
MNQEHKPDRLVITNEDVAPFVAERPASGLREQADRVADKVQEGVATVVNRGGQLVRDKISQAAEQQARATATAVQNRIRETDWKEEAKRETARGLQWLSQQLAQLAERFGPKEKPPR